MVNYHRGEVRSFVPKGRSCPCLYAVTLVDQPGIVKIGRTARWDSRRKTYANWNLSRGEGISEEVVFEINEEWVDLEQLEADVIEDIGLPLRHGLEWFHGTLDEAVRVIEGVLMAHEVWYTVREQRISTAD